MERMIQISLLICPNDGPSLLFFREFLRLARMRAAKSIGSFGVVKGRFVGAAFLGGDEQGLGPQFFQPANDQQSGFLGNIAAQDHRQIFQQGGNLFRRNAFRPFLKVSDELGLVGGGGKCFQDE